MKKIYQTIMRDFMSLQKENEEIRVMDTVSMQGLIDKNNETLEELVKKNKELQKRIKELREEKEKKDKENQNNKNIEGENINNRR